MSQKLEDLLRHAREAAYLGAERIKEIYKQYRGGKSIGIWEKGVDDPVTAADIDANRVITQRLKAAFPDHAVLTEEDPGTWKTNENEWVWMVDPLDGTKDFIMGTDEFVTMVGLTRFGKPIIGVIVEPATDIEYFAAEGLGAYKQSSTNSGKLLKITVPQHSDLCNLRVAVSRSHRHQRVDRFIELLGITREISSGSVGKKVALVISGQADIYIHPAPGTKLWDTCAGDIIASEAGAVLLSGTGEKIHYQRPAGDVENNYGLLVCKTDITETVISASKRVWNLD